MKLDLGTGNGHGSPNFGSFASLQTWKTLQESLAMRVKMLAAQIFAGVLAGFAVSQTAFADRFVRQTAADGKVVVTDSETSLQWTQNEIPELNWQEANAHCSALVYGGYKDWRLPTVTELTKLLHYGKVGPASEFPNASVQYLWSSTINAKYGDFAWYVSFGTGAVNGGGKSSRAAVRCIRP